MMVSFGGHVLVPPLSVLPPDGTLPGSEWGVCTSGLFLVFVLMIST